MKHTTPIGVNLWLALLVTCAATGALRAGEIRVDADFPGGNIIVEGIDGDVVRVRPDYRDTEGTWFYWAMRVRGAQGRTLQLVFTQREPIGVRGPAVSNDEGITWRWLGRDGVTNSTFSYTFDDSDDSVMFSVAMPYTQANLTRFLQSIGDNPALRVETLATTRKDRAVERLHVGRLDGKPRYRLLVMARHHACEMMASYALEGVIEAALADDAVGRWFRENVELVVLPFMDKDGVEDGDQGKNRKPRDHNRDYNGESMHIETAAMRQWAPRWASDGKLIAVLDIHCPTLRGPRNEVIYQVGTPHPQLREQQQRFGKALEQAQRGPLRYRAADDLPFGQEWNMPRNFAQGESSVSWAGRLPGVKLSSTIELPYANASGKEVNQETARAFGRDLAKALCDYVKQTAAAE